ncbi:MAG TPA: SAM-dependent methyltransferase [Pusillimonas sp.]|jgi:malonyl-CoA O-methyltransferase|nr:SAM-dependent methyltransferase [Pusillimonas sp.]MBC41468.1 SAM-dependent methyltransferase [Pusillimonas sp.]HBT33403.1 SAM-dependent methyltransferase [Pusillimonas sp.]HCP79273.1 SAM-dependent methyltransferase [Pusillimonas sp.]|tara:strand:- start:15904 stop:16815 length:912 start_codon:yes stop_codon:yes gene_type:complete
MSSPPSLPLNPLHVAQQFARRAPLDEAQFLYGEITQRMLQRLSYIRSSPSVILDAGCGAGHAVEPLRARYPEAQYTGLDVCQPLLNTAISRHAGRRGLWNRLRNKPVAETRFLRADMAKTNLPPESVGLIWSNMALHWHPEPHLVFAEWRRILKPNGLAMFSCLGPASLKELREALNEAQIQTATPTFVDMHDFGDLLIENGFTDPVMDQEIITLTFKSAEKLLSDLSILGGNPSIGRQPGLPGRRWRENLIKALERKRQMDGTLHLTLEVAYGHAWRAQSFKSAPDETRISIDAISRRRPKT